MAVRDERRAVVVLAVIAALGGLVRVVRTTGEPPGAALIAPHLAGEDVVRQAQLSRRAEALARPLMPGERVDVDRAGPEELERLPRVGRELARRIVEEREAGGPFGSLDGLRRVPGIGPAMLRDLQRAAVFSGLPRSPVEPVAGGAAAEGRREETETCLPDGRPLALNRAGAEELACLPGIGPTLAGRIVADRTARGPYRRVEDLDRVRGVGERLVARIRPLLTVP